MSVMSRPGTTCSHLTLQLLQQVQIVSLNLSVTVLFPPPQEVQANDHRPLEGSVTYSTERCEHPAVCGSEQRGRGASVGHQ